MSASSIILLAFIMVCAFGCKPGYKFVSNFLSRKRSCVHTEIENSLNIEKESLSFLNSILLKNENIQEEIKKTIENANYEADLIIKNKEKQIEEMLDNYQDLIISKIDNKISEAVQKLMSDSVIIAAKTAEKLIQEYVRNENNNSEVISSLSRDLSKKLH
ncbi:MAG: hypothetical protein sL5_02960 [Candidatus Mesenet longicola]|uniref:ATP synthase subunit b n=1 Tax=Candidatus Mesenet longicola TaxID=1892558 RepID=A0A8J3HS71_9RICK|nr:MAG: hypothetical protein sGL2_09280 [Candidatus Mesenet longicola]GHM59303.1 MAG: hypothetical protein sL5_02960 [Candidatus Mesenet longicola]